jgi:hypothetical protein
VHLQQAPEARLARVKVPHSIDHSFIVHRVVDRATPGALMTNYAVRPQVRPASLVLLIAVLAMHSVDRQFIGVLAASGCWPSRSSQ